MLYASIINTFVENVCLLYTLLHHCTCLRLQLYIKQSRLQRLKKNLGVLTCSIFPVSIQKKNYPCLSHNKLHYIVNYITVEPKHKQQNSRILDLGKSGYQSVLLSIIRQFIQHESKKKKGFITILKGCCYFFRVFVLFFTLLNNSFGFFCVK